MATLPNAPQEPLAPITGRVRFYYVVATWFGCGFAPLAPGTVGSAATIPLVLALGYLDHIAWSLFVTAAVAVIGARSAHVVAVHRRDDDPGIVVIDEVAGVLVAWLFVAHCPLWIQGLAWLLFRLFDITKPGPIATLEHTRPIGIGIMLDDLLAGVLAGVLASGVHLGWGWFSFGP